MERSQQQKRSKNGLWNPLRFNRLGAKLLGVGILLFLISLLIVNIFIWRSDVSKLEKPVPQPTILYDQKGEIASEISNSKIEGVRINQIPKEVIYAVISTEDQRFYKHNGINYIGIFRALFQNMMSGEVVAGGSTITQQLAKNVFLTQERTYTRKVKELILTKKVERTYSKDEIMERYLNHIYFGEGAWGIQNAAGGYFWKNGRGVNFGGSAMFGGVIKNPFSLFPLKNVNKGV